MTALAIPRMTVDEFLPWAETQEGRWELFDGVPVPMSPEPVIHGLVKQRVANVLERVVAAAGLSCQSLPDCVAVRVNKHRSYQPDALINCGDELSYNALEAPNPIVVVEVLSPSNAKNDLRDKLVGYFQVPSILHYVIVDPDDRFVIHRARGDGEAIATRIVRDGSLRLDPPGIEVPLAELFPPIRTTD